jgi:hypothetical protein
MHAWRGWAATTGEASAARAITWSDWCARQQDTLRAERYREQGVPFSEQQLARLSFVQWLHHTGRPSP